MNNSIRVGITQGDVNGVGYEIILKAFAESEMFELCTPIVYGSPKIATYHKKVIGLPTNFSVINNADEAVAGRLNLVNCNDEEVRVELGQESVESGRAAYQALERAVEEYKRGMLDVIVTAPINKHTIQSESFTFPGHTEYLTQKLGEGNEPLMILMNESLRVALATIHEPISAVASLLSKELIKGKLSTLNRTLRTDFGVEIPKIAVLALNPHAGDGGVIGTEEVEIITPAINEMVDEGVHCFGPFSADGFFGSGEYREFDAVLAMYHDQGLIPFKTIAMNNGVNFTAGLPVVRTSPDHGTAYNIAGRGVADENSLRQSIYAALDIFKRRAIEYQISRHPLKKQFFDRRDDSDKLNLEATDEI